MCQEGNVRKSQESCPVPVSVLTVNRGERAKRKEKRSGEERGDTREEERRGGQRGEKCIEAERGEEKGERGLQHNPYHEPFVGSSKSVSELCTTWGPPPALPSSFPCGFCCDLRVCLSLIILAHIPCQCGCTLLSAPLFMMTSHFCISPSRPDTKAHCTLDTCVCVLVLNKNQIGSDIDLYPHLHLHLFHSIFPSLPLHLSISHHLFVVLCLSLSVSCSAPEPHLTFFNQFNSHLYLYLHLLLLWFLLILLADSPKPCGVTTAGVGWKTRQAVTRGSPSSVRSPAAHSHFTWERARSLALHTAPPVQAHDGRSAVAPAGAPQYGLLAPRVTGQDKKPSEGSQSVLILE